MPTPQSSNLQRTRELSRLKAPDFGVPFEKLSNALIAFLDARNSDDAELIVASRLALAKTEFSVAAELINNIARDFGRLAQLGKGARLSRKTKRQLDSALARLEPFLK